MRSPYKRAAWRKFVPLALLPSAMWGHSPIPFGGCSSRCCLGSTEKPSLDTHTCKGLDIRLASIYNCEKLISDLYKLPSLWYVLIEAQIDYEKICNNSFLCRVKECWISNISAEVLLEPGLHNLMEARVLTRHACMEFKQLCFMAFQSGEKNSISKYIVLCSMRI